MKTSWRNPFSGEQQSHPVEMRFIDMFMAALGALIFLSMLLAFLLRYYPRQTADATVKKSGTDYQVVEFRLATKTLPAARVGEPYEVAFAFRGGLPPARWAVPAGEADIPAGLAFDSANGTLSGTPQRAGVSRFVLRAEDQVGSSESRPFELVVLEPERASRRIENILALAILIVVLLLWLATVFAAKQERNKLRTLIESQSEGKESVQYSGGGGVVETYILGDGAIQTVEGRAKGFQKTSWFFFVLLLIVAAFAAWRLFFS